MNRIIAVLCLLLISFGPTGLKGNHSNELSQEDQMNYPKNIKRMKVEVWSDIMCPYCYIGKHKFETALAQFSNKEGIDIEWKSFQLMPELEKGKVYDLDKILIETRGMSASQLHASQAQLTEAGKQAGISFHFDKALTVNTFDAHRFLHFAKSQGKQNEAEEVLFRAYFSDGKNVGDYTTLVELGKEIGLDAEALKTALENGSHTNEVHADISEAQQLGIRGVPFFVFDRKYAVSGAQDPQAFLETLEKSFAEWQKENAGPKFEMIDGKACTPQGECN